MITSTSLFSSDANLDVPVQTGGASAMMIIMGLVFCCIVFCIALLGVNDWRLDFIFTNGPTVGLMSFMMFILFVLIMYLAFTCKETIQTAQTQFIPTGMSQRFSGLFPGSQTGQATPLAIQ
jgi:hypothetical protein